jgi:hypothetical protein
MPNVYLDPNSYVHLENVLFEKSGRFNTNNCREPFIFLKEYCGQRGINLQTIDLWNQSEATNDDIYISFDHKKFIRRFYWKIRDKRYPIIIRLDKFKKRVLFHFEPPIVMPEIYFDIKKLTKIYDEIFFTWKTGIPKINYFYFPQIYNRIIPECWHNTNRRLLTIINSNRKPIFRYKELLTERVKAIIFFSQRNEIDLYGFGWENPPLFPYWFYKNEIKKVYKGSVKDKYQKLSEYNFALAFENCELPGYITEKIFDCFYVGTIPIYLGAPDIKEYIPADCFIDMRDFKNYNELRKFLKSLTETEIKTYKENGRKFLESEKYKPFTKEHFAEVFVKSILN